MIALAAKLASGNWVIDLAPADLPVIGGDLGQAQVPQRVGKSFGSGS